VELKKLMTEAMTWANDKLAPACIGRTPDVCGLGLAMVLAKVTLAYARQTGMDPGEALEASGRLVVDLGRTYSDDLDEVVTFVAGPGEA